MISNIRKIKLYWISYGYHRIFSSAVWLMAIALPALLLIHYYPAIEGWKFPVSWPPQAEFKPFYLAQVLAVVLLVAFGVWLIISKWHAVWFRYRAWLVSGGLGALWRGLTSVWGMAVILLLGATFLMYGRYWLLGYHHELKDFLTTAMGSKVLAVAALLAMCYWAYQARSRIVIMAFIDYTGDEALKASVTGISAHLLDELARLSDLYKIIDEAVPIANKNEPLAATISVEDIGLVLKDAVTPETKVKLGSFEVPVGAILAFLGRLVQGPCLTGSVHKEGSTLLLVGQISGGGNPGHNWRAVLENFEKPAQESVAPMPIAQNSDDGKKAKPPTDSEYLAKQAALVLNKTLYKLTEQLTFQIFTDLVNVGSPRWEAVRSFTEGLRIYRNTLRKEQDKNINLRKAENRFIQALADDNQFGRCHYNLGIVYKGLGEAESAETAFQAAIKASPGQVDAYYALALNYYWAKRYDDALELCNQALRIGSHEARVWDLKSMVKRKRWESQHQLLKAGEHPEVWKELIPLREIATALAWKDLCRMALRSRSDDSIIGTARTCTRNLAVAHAMIGHYDQSRTLFKQAICLPPADTALYFELGKTLAEAKDWQGAIEAFEQVRVRELATTEQAAYWAYFAHVQAKGRDSGYRTSAVRHAYDRFLDVAVTADKELLKTILYENVAGQQTDYVIKMNEALKTTKAEYSSNYPDFLISLAQNQSESSDESIERLNEQLESYKNWPWAEAQIKIGLAQQFLYQNKQFDQARDFLKEAIHILEKDRSSSEIKDRKLYGYLAEAYRLDGMPKEALFHAERAVTLAPEGAWEHSVLACVYFDIKDYRRAEDEWTTGFNLDPDIPGTFDNIAQTYWNRGVELRNPVKRKEAFEQVVTKFQHELDISQSHPIYNSPESEQAKTLWYRGKINYWLGIFNRELLNNEQAISHFKIAQQLGYKPVESRLELGLTYFNADAYDEAEQFFREVATQLRRRDDHPAKLRMFKAQLSDDDQYGQDGDPKIHEFLLKTLLYSAYALAKRGVRLTSAQDYIKCAKPLLPLLPCKKMDPALRRDYHRLLHDCQGLIFLKAAQLRIPFNGKKSVELYKNAIRELENAVMFKTDGETYLHLAQAYFEYACVNQPKRKSNIARARDALKHAHKNDLRGGYTTEPGDLEQQLAKLADAKNEKL